MKEIMLEKGECQVTLLQVVFLSDSSMHLSFCFSNHVFSDIYSNPREKRLFPLRQIWCQVWFLKVPTQGDHACILICLHCLWLFATLWTVAWQVLLSIGFSWQEHWSGLPCPPPGGSSWPRDLTHISYISFTGRFFTTNTTWEGH